MKERHQRDILQMRADGVPYEKMVRRWRPKFLGKSDRAL